MLTRCFVILLLAVCGLSASAQNKQGNIWYFGRNAGLDFNTEPPSILTDGELNTWEGCASIADANGNLLFYTDGIRAWDKNHNRMPNGTSLGGNPSSTQSGVIVPYPGNDELFYLFSVDELGGELQYGIVDMALNGGLGNLQSKNNILLDPSTEKITAVQHANGVDFWVIGHEWNSNRFFLWLITETGISATPLIISIGSVHEGHLWNSIGFIKLSPTGQYLAIASFYRGDFVEIFEFNNESGNITNPVKLENFRDRGAYGLEFSPNERFLYISERQASPGRLWQVELPTSSGNIADKANLITSKNSIGALQLAPNGKIYLAQDNHRYLNVIHSPNLEGNLCQYEDDAQFLDGRWSGDGLPTFIQSFFRSIDFEFANLCENDQTNFTIKSTQLSDIDSVVWDFGDTNSGAANESRLLNPSHVFSAAGDYTVSLQAYFDDRPVLLAKGIAINPLPDAGLTEATGLVNGTELNISIAGDLSALWSDSSTDLNRSLNSPGWHWVDVTNSEQCTTRDSLAIFKINYADTCFSTQTSFTLEAGNINVDSLQWNFGDPNSGSENLASNANASHEFSNPGDFSVGLTTYYKGKQFDSNFSLTINPLPDAGLTEATGLVNGAELNISIAGDLSALWSDSSTDLDRSLNSPGWHWVDVTNSEQCTTRDSLAIFKINYADTCFSTQTSFTLEAGNINVDSLQWNFGDPNSGSENLASNANASHDFSNPGDFTVGLTTYYQGRQFDSNFSLTINPLPDAGLPESISLINDKTETLTINNLQTIWDNGNTDNSRRFSDPGWHWADVTNAQQCASRDSLAIFKINYADTCFSSSTSLILESGNIMVDSVLWNMGDPNAGNENLASGQQITHHFTQEGTFSVNADIYFGGRQASASFILSISALPDIDLGPDETLFYGESRTLSAAGSGISYQWQDDSSNETYEVTSPGTYWIDVTNQAGCLQRDSVIIDYDQVIDVALPADTVLCLGEQLDLDVSLPEASYLWQDGSTGSGITVTTGGTYWVDITNAYGNRTLRDSIEVSYYQFGELSVEAQVVICEEQAVALTASGAVAGERYRWYDRNLNLLEENEGTFNTGPLNSSTDYYVALTNGRCEDDPVMVSVIYDLVIADVMPSDTIVIELGESVNMEGFGGDTFSWAPNQWLNTDEGRMVIASPEDDIEYTLTATSILGCSAEVSLLILLEKEIDIPNAITPNGDGFNDVWKIKNIERYPENSILIFDREGNRLQEFKGYQNTWDGTVNGKRLPAGTYFYIIDLGDGSAQTRGALSIISR